MSSAAVEIASEKNSTLFNLVEPCLLGFSPCLNLVGNLVCTLSEPCWSFFIFGKILLTDGDAVELGLEEGLGFGQRIDPSENGFEFLVIFEAMIELFPDGLGELGDFTVHKLKTTDAHG